MPDGKNADNRTKSLDRRMTPGRLRAEVANRGQQKIIKDKKILPITRVNIGKRAFSVTAPTIWNQINISIKYFETIVSFCKKTP